MGARTLVEHRLTVPAGPPVLAVGAWFKNTVCTLDGTSALISASIGDLDSVLACQEHERTVRDMVDGMTTRPAAVAHDLHPDFHSTRVAEALAEQLDIPSVAVQHHHAHIASVLSEHGHAGPALGLALDGVGLGTDGTAWGGELLVVEPGRWQRIAGLRPLPLPGGDRAAREPWRMAAAVLHDVGRGAEIAERFADQPAAAGLCMILDRGLRCPPTSSLGRVFDAAAGLLGLSRVMTTEAEAAIALEAAAQRHGTTAPMPDGWIIGSRGGDLDLRPVLASLVDEPDIARGAARFHATLAVALVEWVASAARTRDVTTLAVGGGCLFNAILRTGLRSRCADARMELLEPVGLLPGDSAISFGQAMVARQSPEVV